MSHLSGQPSAGHHSDVYNFIIQFDVEDLPQPPGVMTMVYIEMTVIGVPLLGCALLQQARALLLIWNYFDSGCNG